jgi:mRNA interferase YafQ
MHELFSTKGFERSLAKLLRKNPGLEKQIEDVLVRMETNIDDPRLKTHRLGGKLKGMSACSVGYDCRIVFSRGTDAKTRRPFITLHNVGTHDEVY